MAMGAAAFGGWGLLLPVVPLAVSVAGGSDAAAGASTAIFMATTVVTQLFVPRMLARFGHRLVLAAGCIFLGAPAASFALSVDVIPALSVSAVRGIGFGMLTVAASALVAELAPPSQLGRATGAQGIAVALSQAVTLPAGLALFAVSPTSVFLIGAAVPLLGLVAIVFLPPIRPVVPARGEPQTPSRGFGRLLIPCLAIAAASASFGGLSSLLPIAEPGRESMIGIALSVVSVAMLVGRYGAGVIADHIGIGWALAPALALVGGGVAVFAFAVFETNPAVVFMAAAVLFGLGYGATQNDSLVMAFDAAGRERYSQASAAWNIGFDAGTGAGAMTLGLVVGTTGYTGGFAMVAVVAFLMAVVVATSRRMQADRLGP
ncbi:MFS transporter [Rhodococcus sp. BP-252]|uniref:MFS transporter n=1 Tax=unclassified Rhodococcus (in: high G+C Gram-positive bacteria) TaxID=192944 RepID=UPI001C9AD2F0|nr:MFS transporter [Rhodococcus sp. BP-320]MBY6415955.1 MFS transporter [Rhodococcus sp. BP-321]MBY6420536.1 MFS transporter [Rhodococcus sp. BP-324]MBY6426162.1 MFS transporter [Rhodococcus sp. BP-323]MBY6431297.1 MFS transporter [Rhodococcus sp. BP-322]MBY6440375.1 MFS transporter [Rhodococcus sp. BP-319]MBY6444998.1 MFS transporter [Rhodococcus sp. BP-318]MBY6450048.1 MFS transporter [Rhodococcus sp. BP-315]MBY6455135.1 MFS transporter [Rhodococcus sp. BP-277]MBY6459392.1 MFS transporte